MDRIPTGIKTFDNIIGGGLPKGSAILVVGTPGSGKTILANQIAFHNASPDCKVLYLTTLSEPQVKVMKFQSEFEFFSRDKFQSSVIYHDLGSILRKQGYVHALITIDDLLKKYQPKLIIIDTIKTISEIVPSMLEFREFLIDLSLRLATWGCTALFLCEYGEDEIGIRSESAIADGIIYLSGTEEKKQQKRYLRILKMRGTGYIGGENVFKITAKGIEIFPRLTPDITLQSNEYFRNRISTGIQGLDKMMGGGIPRGTTTLLSGASGTGKTLLSLHFIYNGLQSGEAAVYVSFEENIDQTVYGAQNLGIDLRPYLESGQLKMLYVSPMELDTDEHIYRVQKMVRDLKAERLAIDSISSFELGMKDKIKYTDYIYALTDYFKTQGVTVLLTHEIHDSLNVSEITKYGISFVADNLILMRFVENEMDVKRFLRVVKMRSSRHDTMLRELCIDENGMNII